MEKLHMIIWITIIALVGYGVARTAYYDNKTDAMQALGNPITLTGGDCKVLSVEESIELGNMEGNIIATYEVQFYKPNYDRRIGKTIVSSTNQQTIENEIRPKCDDLWVQIQAEPQFQKVDAVVVQYHEGTLEELVTNRAYDVVKKTWRDLISAQP